MKIFQASKRTVGTTVLALAIGIAPITAATSAPTATASVCEAHWGSLVKKSAPHTGKQIARIRSGQHRCFDRLVVVLNGNGDGTPGYRVEYVDTVTKDGS